MRLAILDIIAENKVPLLATVGTSSVVEPIDAKRRWVFKTTQNDDLIASALIEHMRKNGVRTVGFIGFNDAYGENWYKVFGALAEKAGIAIVANERYARNDSSVTAQALKLIAAKPDAVLIAAVGGPAVLPQITLYDQGYKGRIYQTHAVATDDFIRLGKEKVEGTDTRRRVDAGDRRHRRYRSDQAGRDRLHRARTKSGSAAGPRPSAPIHSTRACCCSGRFPIAVRTAKPGTEAFRVALRDALEQQQGVVGCQGVFNMSPTNHNGMDERARVLVVVKDGRFRLLSAVTRRRKSPR